MWPKSEKVVPVSTTVSPVTHRAEVAVNSASRKERGWPFAEAIGKLNKIVPIAIIATNPNTSALDGVSQFDEREGVLILTLPLNGNILASDCLQCVRGKSDFHPRQTV